MNSKLKSEYISLTPKDRLYEMQTPLIGLTGGIACGKSTVARVISKKFNIPVINADTLVKKAYEKNEVITFLKEKCPQSLIDGKVNFSILREWVFSKDDNRSLIESAIYKHLPTLFKNETSKLDSDIIIYDVPLLFEKGLNSKVDLVICVSCDEATQIERIINRDNCSKEVAKKIIDSQMSLAEKEKMSQIVFRNDGNLGKIEQEISKKIKNILVS